MRFFVEVQNNQPVAQGRVGKQIDPSHFFVRYDAPKKYGRIVSLALMENFALFDDEEELAQFVAAPAAAVDAPVEAPEAPIATPTVEVDPAPAAGL